MSYLTGRRWKDNAQYHYLETKPGIIQQIYNEGTVATGPLGNETWNLDYWLPALTQTHPGHLTIEEDDEI